jgi:hypothetical protein
MFEDILDGLRDGLEHVSPTPCSTRKSQLQAAVLVRAVKHTHVVGSHCHCIMLNTLLLTAACLCSVIVCVCVNQKIITQFAQMQMASVDAGDSQVMSTLGKYITHCYTLLYI